jgi:CheY-like chemotaxis protein
MKDVSFLLVDDSPIIKKMVKKVLENIVGAKAVHAANNTKEALEILRSESVDFIINNWENPDIMENGLLFETHRKMEWKEIPFVIMTSIDTEEFYASAMRQGATQVIQKPVTVRDLENSVRKFWNAASKRQASRFSMLPPHQMAVNPAGNPFDAKVVNLSATGCLIRLQYNDALRLFGKYEFNLGFDDVRGKSVGKVSGTVIRLENDTADIESPDRICLAAVAFDKKGMDEQTKRALDDVIRWLESMNPEAIA